MFQFGNAAVFQLGDFSEVVGALGFGHVGARLFELLTQGLQAIDLRFFRLIACRQCGELFLHLGQFRAHDGQTIARAGVLFRLEGGGFDIELQFAALQRVDGFGLRVQLHARFGAGFVDQIDSLVGQKAPLDVATRETCCGDQSCIGDTDTVVRFVTFFQAAQDRDGVFD